MAANTYDVYDVTIEKRYGIGKNEKYPIVLCTPGGNYVGYSAKLILDFLNKGEMSRLEQGIDDMQTLYMLYMVEVCKQDNLRRENENLKEELEFVRGDNTEFEEDVKQLTNVLKESQRNNMELVAENQRLIQKNFELDSQVNTLKKSRDGYRDCLQQKLQEEIIKLMNECNYLQKRNEGLSGSVEMLKKENKELKEQLKVSSDLTMTNELADIFAEYTVADQKNRDDLGDKITEFRRKYGLE